MNRLLFSACCAACLALPSAGMADAVPVPSPADASPRLAEIAAMFDGRIGFCVLDLDSGESAAWGDEGMFPMMSVFKFPLALSVLSRVDEGKLDLDAKYEFTADRMIPDTWSPIREKFPRGGSFTLRELLRYTVAESDNIACDFLFGLIGGPQALQADLKRWRAEGIRVQVLEAEMQKDWDAQYLNAARPSAMAGLLKSFVEGKILKKETQDVLWGMMAGCKTGAERLASGVPKGAVLAHKTGSSGVRKEDGLIGALNDVGVAVLPDGRRLAICAFVSDSRRPMAECGAVIATLARWACSEWARAGRSR